jgi:hypothetical protein
MNRVYNYIANIYNHIDRYVVATSIESRFIVIQRGKKNKRCMDV